MAYGKSSLTGESMSDNGSHVTRPELQAELRALQYRILLYLGITVGLLEFHLPVPVTLGALLAMVGKSAWVIFLRH